MRTKLISVRLDEDLVAKLSSMCVNRPYYNRSFLINIILRNVLECSDAGTLRQIISSFNAYSDGFTVHFVRDKKVISR